MTVLVGNLGALTLAHSTVVPGNEIAVHASATDAARRNEQLALTIDHSIAGALSVPESSARIRILDSIVSNGNENDFTDAAVDAPTSVVDVERSTVLGSLSCGAIEARNCLFMSAVTAVRRQTGCVSFSYLSADSRVPRRYRCQPDLEIELRIREAEERTGNALTSSERDAVRLQTSVKLAPTFTSLRYGAPGYCQLRDSAPAPIRMGADDEAEMGAFHDLMQPQRETNLRVRLEEYLRLGLEAGVFHVT
jgi:hypothetical protein